MSIQIGKKVTYRMIESESYVEDAGWITSYGICCEEKNPDNETVLTRTISDISTRSGFVEDLVEKLIHYEASPIHLMDIISDHLL